MAIAGIDFSSQAVHICTLPEDSNLATVHTVRLDLGGGNLLTRARRLRDQMPARTAWRDAGITLIAIEKPFSHQPRNVASMNLVYGGILQCLPANIPLLELSPGDWRKECLITNRGDTKAASIRFARQTWADPPHALDHNTADAFAIAWAAREIDIRAAA